MTFLVVLTNAVGKIFTKECELLSILDFTGVKLSVLCSFGRHHSLTYRFCLQRCFQMVSSSLLDSVLLEMSQLVISSLLEIIVILLEDQIDFCALLGAPQSHLQILPPEMFPSG